METARNFVKIVRKYRPIGWLSVIIDLEYDALHVSNRIVPRRIYIAPYFIGTIGPVSQISRWETTVSAVDNDYIRQTIGDR